LTKRSLDRRSLLRGAAVVPLALSAAACGKFDMSDLFGGSKKRYTLTPRGDRLVRWLQNEGRDGMMDPEPFAVMGLVNGGRDIPVKQMGMNGKDGRYVISLVGFRSVHEFVLHRTVNDTLIVFHHCDTKFTRFSSVRYQRNGKPQFITDTAFAEADFQQQLAFWFDQMPGR
jgi:hypothetical protein